MEALSTEDALLVDVLQALARGYCSACTSARELDPVLCNAMADEIIKLVNGRLSRLQNENASLRNQAHVFNEITHMREEMLEVMKRVRFLHTRSGMDEFQAAWRAFDEVLNRHGVETPEPKPRPY